MAPEVILKQQYGAEVDVWSLGVMALEIAEWDPPYIEFNTTKALFLISTQGVPSLKDKKKWSSDFKDFVEKCVEKDAAKRTASIELLQVSLYAQPKLTISSIHSFTVLVHKKI
jgi:serine/threonine protein kinase